MAQHFLLSAAARNLSLKKVFRLSDNEAREVFASVRWVENGGQPVCPKCGNAEKSY